MNGHRTTTGPVPGGARLLRRLAGDADAGPAADLARLLAVRQGASPACPELGLPAPHPWLGDGTSRRRLQEAIAATVRAGEPRLTEVAVAASADGTPSFTITATAAAGAALAATARLEGGRVGVSA